MNACDTLRTLRDHAAELVAIAEELRLVDARHITLKSPLAMQAWNRLSPPYTNLSAALANIPRTPRPENPGSNATLPVFADLAVDDLQAAQAAVGLLDDVAEQLFGGRAWHNLEYAGVASVDATNVKRLREALRLLGELLGEVQTVAVAVNRDTAPAALPDAAPLTGEAKALALLVQHPEWSDTKIAKEIGCSRTSLYRWPKYAAARETLTRGRDDMPRGSKDAEAGTVEAWDAD